MNDKISKPVRAVAKVEPVKQDLSIENLLMTAVQNGVSVETMERLVALRSAMKAEAAKEAFNAAMAKFQSECPTIQKTKGVKTKSGIVAYKYAPIESIIEQVKEPIQENGFSYSTSMELLSDGVKVSVKITHTQGHSETSEMQVPFGSKTEIMSQTQVAAAATTFAKRYAFCNALGIMTGDEDTDAAVRTKPAKKVEEEVYDNSPVADDAPVIVTGTEEGEPQIFGCVVCEENITAAEYDWSIKHYGKRLCRAHQKSATKIK